MAQICPTSIQVCRVRVTRLTATGAIASAPNNHVVSDAAIQLTMDPEVVVGEAKNLVSGCDCIYATYKGKDKLIRWNLTLQTARQDPALFEILTGAPVITNVSSELIGNSWPDQTSCSSTQQPFCMIEAWSNAWVADAANSATPYVRWVFPGSFWQFDTQNLQNDFATPQFKGFTRGNTVSNSYVDWPTGISVGRMGGYFYDTAVPAAYCGYSTTST